MVTQKFDLPFFDRIELNDNFDVYLQEDTASFIEVLGDDRILDKFTYQVVDSVLTLDLNSNTKFLTPRRNKIEIYVHSSPLQWIHANRTCAVRTVTPITSQEFGIVMKSKANEAFLELDCFTFYYWNEYPCGGTLELRGNAEETKIWNGAIVTVDASQLTTKYALVENGARTDCRINVTEKLDYSITGEGNIYTSGAPPTIVLGEDTGTGELIHQ